MIREFLETHINRVKSVVEKRLSTEYPNFIFNEPLDPFYPEHNPSFQIHLPSGRDEAIDTLIYPEVEVLYGLHMIPHYTSDLIGFGGGILEVTQLPSVLKDRLDQIIKTKLSDSHDGVHKVEMDMTYDGRPKLTEVLITFDAIVSNDNMEDPTLNNLRNKISNIISKAETISGNLGVRI